MATTSTMLDLPAVQATRTKLVVSLASLSDEGFERTLGRLAEAFPGEAVVVATPDVAAGESTSGALRVVGYTPVAASPGAWLQTAADYLTAHELAQKHGADVVLMLGGEAQTLEAGALKNLVEGVVQGGCDLAMPRYALPARAGLVNSAILYPLTRALFAARPRFPLALDMGLSSRMAERMATAAQRFTAANQPDALIWPVGEAAVAGFTIGEVEVGTRAIPAPATLDLNTVLAHVAGSLFADVDAKAAFWQRARPVQPARTDAARPRSSEHVMEVQPMIDGFRLAYTNLAEIWSLVLPPHSLLGLKRLAAVPASEFKMADSLWARVVYDFLLAYRLRTINRGHLLGALTPLYLAWVASHIVMTEAGADPERHVEALAAAFEADKPYLVSRWRWPDRFNP